ncbi:MAG: hypothetical protein K2J71_05385 [Oscillospiraceae bacterium]|nr:hypothetical protein [Oscillospiraceae bacterium]
MKAAIVKFLLSLLADKRTRHRILLMIGSIIVGLFCMMILPFVVLSTLNKTEPPEIETEFDESELLSAIDADRLTAMEINGQILADILFCKGLSNQIMKAQLIYLSYSDDNQITDFDEYTNVFHIEDDNILIDCLNSDYAFEIDKDEFQRTYLLVKNATIDPYLFTSPETKNSTDLAAWCRNAYESGWLSESGRGEINPEKQWRTADNVGLLLGYLNYHPNEKLFSNDYDTLFYTEQGFLDTMPDVAGIGVFNGEEFGIYAGNDEVIFCSEIVGHAEKTDLTCGIWTNWCTFDAVEYPQEVWNAVQALQLEESEEIYEDESEESANENSFEE